MRLRLTRTWNAGTARSVTEVSTPSIPSEIRTASSRSSPSPISTTSPAAVTNRHLIMLDERLVYPLPWLPVLIAPPTVTQSIPGAQLRVSPFSQRAGCSTDRGTPTSHVTVRPATSISLMASRRSLAIMTSLQYQSAFQEVRQADHPELLSGGPAALHEGHNLIFGFRGEDLGPTEVGMTRPVHEANALPFDRLHVWHPPLHRTE